MEMTDEQKQILDGLVDDDGKLIVTDSMPEDLKAAINYLNENRDDLSGIDEDLKDNEEIDNEIEALNIFDKNTNVEAIDVDEEEDIDDEDDIDDDDIDDDADLADFL